uniref:Uncharacterized protein n=1 Tax=Anguilla anguilla TaxID=7936 RepID=A0A0E9WBT4_ANGAN
MKTHLLKLDLHNWIDPAGSRRSRASSFRILH